MTIYAATVLIAAPRIPMAGMSATFAATLTTAAVAVAIGRDMVFSRMKHPAIMMR